LRFLGFLISVGWYVVAAGLVFTLALIVLSPFVAFPAMRVTIPVSFSVDPQVVRFIPTTADADRRSEQNVRIGSHEFAFEVGTGDWKKDPQVHVRGSLRFPTESRGLFAGAAVLLLALLSIVFWGLGQLRAVFRTLRDGHPFAAANAIRIRRIAIAVILGEVGRSIVVFITNYYAATHFAAEGLRFDARPDLSITAIVHGLIILAVAEVFHAGTRLDEDQSLTI